MTAARNDFIHALSADGRAMLATFAARRALLTFDVDGTLAPIVARPEDAGIPPALREALVELAALAPVAILTGRAVADARRMLGFAPRYVLGNHGVEGLPGFEARGSTLAAVCAAWHAALGAAQPSLADAGVHLEDKRYSLSLHYRHAPDAQLAQALIARHVAALVPPAHVVGGKCVVNVLPPGALTKGDALTALLAHEGLDAAIYAGDDATDEHVFDLPRERVLGIRVGHLPQSNAALYVDHPGEMLPLVRLLTTLVGGAAG